MRKKNSMTSVCDVEALTASIAANEQEALRLHNKGRKIFEEVDRLHASVRRDKEKLLLILEERGVINRQSIRIDALMDFERVLRGLKARASDHLYDGAEKSTTDGVFD